MWSYTSTSPYIFTGDIFMAWYLVKHRDITFTFPTTNKATKRTPDMGATLATLNEVFYNVV
jgi:hypothetical protein